MGSVDPTIAEKVTNFVNHRRDMSEALLNDPVNAVLNAGLGDKIQSQINSSIDNAVRKTTLRNQAEQFIDANREVLYVSDPSTGQTQQDANGNPVLSPVGRALNDAHVMLRQNGVTDPVTRHQIATQMVQNHFTQQQLQTMPQQTQEEQYKQEYTQQPFAQPSNPMPPGYMPNTPVQPQANSIGANGLPEHTSLGSLATALAVHKGFLQPK